MNGELRVSWLEQYCRYSHWFLSSVCTFYVKGPNFFIPQAFLSSVQGFVYGYKHAVLMQVIYNHVRAQVMCTYNQYNLTPCQIICTGSQGNDKLLPALIFLQSHDMGKHSNNEISLLCRTTYRYQQCPQVQADKNQGSTVGPGNSSCIFHSLGQLCYAHIHKVAFCFLLYSQLREGCTYTYF